MTQTAKDLIRSMLTVDVERRIDINTFMRSPWIAQYQEVPTTPLGMTYYYDSFIIYDSFSDITESER